MVYSGVRERVRKELQAKSRRIQALQIEPSTSESIGSKGVSMNDLVFKPSEPLPGLDKKLQHQMEALIEKALDELLESHWFVELVDDRIRMVVDIMNEESDTDAHSE